MHTLFLHNLIARKFTFNSFASLHLTDSCCSVWMNEARQLINVFNFLRTSQTCHGWGGKTSWWVNKTTANEILNEILSLRFASPSSRREFEFWSEKRWERDREKSFEMTHFHCARWCRLTSFLWRLSP